MNDERFIAKYRDGYYVVIDTANNEIVAPPSGHYKAYKDGYLWGYAAALEARRYNDGERTMQPQVCNHGFWVTHCALCLKREGECDYGSCQQEATHTVVYRRSTGVIVERRPMCADHAHGNRGAADVCDRLHCNDTIGPCAGCPA